MFISNLARDITYDASTKEIVITKQDGSQMRISVVDLVDIYTGFNGTHIQVTVESGNVIHAVLKSGTITEAELSAALLAKLAMKTDVATSISEHNADTTAHGIDALKNDIEDIKSDIEDLQSNNSSGSVNWANIDDKPSTFPPSSHNHTLSEITDFDADDFALKSDIPDVSDFITEADIPTNVSAFTNDSGYATTTQVATAKGEAIEAAADYTDEQVADAKLATQRWLPAVQTKSALPGALASTSWNYLCRVLHDPTPSNNGVWQAIPIDANNHAANWTWFGDNQDFIDELELEEALEAERTISDNSYLGKTAKAADSNKLDGKNGERVRYRSAGNKSG